MWTERQRTGQSFVDASYWIKRLIISSCEPVASTQDSSHILINCCLVMASYFSRACRRSSLPSSSSLTCAAFTRMQHTDDDEYDYGNEETVSLIRQARWRQTAASANGAPVPAPNPATCSGCCGGWHPGCLPLLPQVSVPYRASNHWCSSRFPAGPVHTHCKAVACLALGSTPRAGAHG
jgi:hypothetical protein